jgi:ABC-type multidrug transport system fused ATPase/permease subunit
MKTIKQLNQLLTISQKRKVIILSFFIIFGILFEMAGIGLLIPIMSIVLKADLVFTNKHLYSLFIFLGKPNHEKFITLLLSSILFFFTVKYFYLLFLNKKQTFFSTSLSSDLSQKLFNGYMKLPYSFHLNNNSAILLRNIQIEVYQITTVTQAFINLFMELSVIVGMIMMLFLIEPLGAFCVAIFLLITASLFHQKNKKNIYNWGVKRKISSSKMNKYILEGLGGVKDIKFLGRESYFINRYQNHNVEYSIINANSIFLSQVPRLYLELLSIFALVFMIIIQIYQGRSTEELIPILSMFLAASFRLIPSVNKILAALQSIKFTKPVVEGLVKEFELINNNTNDNKIRNTIEDPLKFNSTIEIINLDYKYPNNDNLTLNQINLKIFKGTTIGLIGSSGSGKSTLIDIILGILKCKNNDILIDGVSINNNLRNWQNKLGYVPQMIFLSDETIRKNIAFGIEDELIDDEKIEIALKLSNLKNFISTLPDGIETVVGERGVRLSGGQRQRIGIARALYYNPEVIIFDEATSALDHKTEESVMESINELKKLKTMIIVAHRLTTLKKCDIIYELKNGKLLKQIKPEDI